MNCGWCAADVGRASKCRECKSRGGKPPAKQRRPIIEFPLLDFAPAERLHVESPVAPADESVALLMAADVQVRELQQALDMPSGRQLVDAYREALDYCIYLRRRIYKWHGK